MTQAATPLRADGQGNGVTVNWPYDWLVEDEAHLLVTKVTIAKGVEETLVLNTDYTVTGVGAGSGFVVITPALTADYRLVITPNLPEEQDIDFTNEASVPPERVELGMDRLTRLIKQLSEKITRAVLLPVGSDQTPENYLLQMAEIYADVLALQVLAAANQDAAQLAENNAETAEVGAIDARNLAEKWASEAVDVVVQSGKFSAFHWAMKAALASGLNSGSNSKQFSAMADGAGLVEFRNIWAGLPTIRIANATDFDTLTAAGRYWSISTGAYVNAPLATNGFLDVYSFDFSSQVIQIFTPSAVDSTFSDLQYMRRYSGSVWTPWCRVNDRPNTWSKPQRGAEVNVNYAASIALDLSQSNNFTIGTLTGPLTLAAPTNAVIGQSGSIRLTQDATGGRVITYNAAWKFPYGSKTPLSTAGNAVDKLYYYVRAANIIDCWLAPGMG